MTPEEDRHNPTERDRQREDLRLIIGLAVWAIAVEIRAMEARVMARINGDPSEDPAPGEDDQPESDTNKSSGEGIDHSDQWPPKEK